MASRRRARCLKAVGGSSRVGVCAWRSVMLAAAFVIVKDGKHNAQAGLARGGGGGVGGCAGTRTGGSSWVRVSRNAATADAGK